MDNAGLEAQNVRELDKLIKELKAKPSLSDSEQQLLLQACTEFRRKLAALPVKWVNSGSNPDLIARD